MGCRNFSIRKYKTKQILELGSTTAEVKISLKGISKARLSSQKKGCADMQSRQTETTHFEKQRIMD